MNSAIEAYLYSCALYGPWFVYRLWGFGLCIDKPLIGDIMVLWCTHILGTHPMNNACQTFQTKRILPIECVQ